MEEKLMKVTHRQRELQFTPFPHVSCQSCGMSRAYEVGSPGFSQTYTVHSLPWESVDDTMAHKRQGVVTDMAMCLGFDGFRV